jgi:hypothetical protein
LDCLLPVSDPEELNKHFPTVDFVFDNNKMVTLAPENYLFKVWPLSIKEVQILLLV